ncbi:hypothetical protein [Streptomyces sp. NPDC048248]|uniref:hypothetical protein n=1 Tax=Streptomyces sp. NPDC048248 TaxID=3365523 RepID=UPI0037239AD0
MARTSAGSFTHAVKHFEFTAAERGSSPPRAMAGRLWAFWGADREPGHGECRLALEGGRERDDRFCKDKDDKPPRTAAEEVLDEFEASQVHGERAGDQQGKEGDALTTSEEAQESAAKGEDAE